nr:phage tail protein [Pseudomonas sp. P818]
MSSGGQILGGVVGAVIGFYVGGPVGALQGAALGAGIGAALDPPKGPTVEGPRLNDLKIQTSTLGQKIPRFYGTVGVSGNIIWMENNQLKETVRKEKQGGGKGGGGGSQTVKTYSYSATFALCLGEGPISGIRRIWCSDKLIYNAGSDDLETIIASNKAAAGMRFYYGTEVQLPDPRIEAEMGAGNAPAFRGRAYIVFDDFQLADYSNTLQAAQFKVECVTKQDSIGLRLADTIAQNYLNLDETSTLVEFSGGVVRFSSNPLSPRDWLGGVGNYHTYKLRASDGKLVSFGLYDGFISCPELSVLNYPLGESDGYYWSFHFNNSKTYLKIYGESIQGITNHEYEPYPGESRVGFGAYIADGLLYIFRQRPDMSCYVEIASGSSIVSSHNILNKNGTPYTHPIGDIAYHASSGYTPIVENGGQCIWVVGANEHDARVITFLYKNGAYVLDQQIISSQNSNRINGAADGSVLCLVYRSTIRLYVRSIDVSPDDVSLASIITSESSLSSLIAGGDLDVSLLTESVKGFVVPGGTIRSAIEPLQAAYPFDVIPSGYKIKYVPRGRTSVAVIPMSDIGAGAGESAADLLTELREMDTQLPAKTVIKYIDFAREYDQSEQTAERINTQAVNKVERELPIVMTAHKAAGVAEVLQSLAWLERNEYSFALPPSYGNLEPSDVVTIYADDATYELLIRSAKHQQNGILQCSAKPNRAAVYAPVAEGGEVPGSDGSIPLSGLSLAVLMDIPVVDETLQDAVGFVCVMTGFTDGWPGALLVRSPDSGQTFTDIQAFSGKGTFGTARNSLPVSNSTIIDGRTLTLDLASGSLSSITRDQMLSGAHYAAYGSDGRWEIVRFQNATLNSDGSYSVSGFVRGEKGTEWATGLHQSGDWFVMLDDPDNAFIGMAAESIGVDFYYRAVTSGDSVDDSSNIDFTYRGVNLECLSPVYASGTRDGSGNFSGSFTRRSRLTGTWWATGTPSPVGEATEAYAIDVMNGLTVVRSISVTSPSFTYSAANQITDFGSAQSSIKFRIYQLSGIVGRGYPLEVTL